MNEKTPLIYDETVDVNVSDLDFYSHVNTTHYMDYVLTSRFKYSEKHLGVTFHDIMKKGLGFFVTHFEINFLKPISHLGPVRIISHIETVKDKEWTAAFNLVSVDKNKVFSKGTFTFVPIDLKTTKPCVMPEWAESFFFKS